MTLKVEIATNAEASAWEDITDQINLATARFAGTASRGEINTGSGFDWRDDAGTRVIPWRRRVVVYETITDPDTLLWQGRTVGDEVRRGVIRTDDSKQFDVNLVDVNADFGGIPFVATQRPVETDIDRIDFLLDNYLQGQSRASTVIGDTYLNRSIPYNLIAHLYSGVQPIDWFTHMTDTTGREFFLTREFDLFHDGPASTAYASGLSITDDGPDFSGSFPPILPEATEDATEMFTRVRGRWAGGTVNVVRSAVEAANDQWGTFIVDESVTSAAAMTAKANVFLDQFDHSRTTFRCGIIIPALLVSEISWGMTISFRSAACGILTPTTYRITNLSWSLAGEGLYLADMELNYASKFRRASNPGTITPPPATPFVPGCSPGATDLNLTGGTDSDGGGVKTFSSPTNANDEVHDVVSPTYASVGSFAAGVGSYEAYLDADLGSAQEVVAVNVWGEYECGTNPTLVQAIAPDGGWSIWHSDNGSSWTKQSYTATWNGLSGYDGKVEYCFTAPSTHRYWRVRYERYVLSGLAFMCGTDIESFEIYGGTVNAPIFGQDITETATGDGTTTAGSPTAHAYIAGTLRITVNGPDVTAHVTETDPSAGTFTFATAPASGADIVIRYKAAA